MLLLQKLLYVVFFSFSSDYLTHYFRGKHIRFIQIKLIFQNSYSFILPKFAATGAQQGVSHKRITFWTLHFELMI